MDYNMNDLKLVRQHNIDLKIKLEIYDRSDKYITELKCNIISGSFSITAESDMRRTASIECIPDAKSRLIISEQGLIWLDKFVKLYLGIYDKKANDYRWWKQGKYVFTSTSTTYDATNNQLSISCSDLMSMLDGTKNGQLGQQTIILPAYEEDEETGEVIEYNYIRAALIQTLTQLGRIKDYNIDEIGEIKGMPQYNEDYLQYREESKVPVQDGTLMETWNAVPYDLEFSSGCSVLSILSELVNLYPNYEMYFNEDGVFCCNMIPSCYDDDIVLHNDFLKKIFISESSSVDLSAVRNVVEVWGSTIDADFYANENVILSGTTYTATIDGYEEDYYNGDSIALKVESTNPENVMININGFGEIPVYDDNTEEPLVANKLEANNTYVFKIKKKYVNGSNVTRAYFLGSWQVHAIAVLTDGTTGADYTTTMGNTVKRYSKEYYQDIYNCENVVLDIIPDSPFTVQKLGEILQVCTGGNFEQIYSNSLGEANALYELWKSAILTDSISITTKICPFADVNIKISYQPELYDSDSIHQYIVKSLSHDFNGGTTSWNFVRFYPLYEPDVVVPDTNMTDLQTN